MRPGFPQTGRPLLGAMTQHFSKKFDATSLAARDGIAEVMRWLHAMGLPPVAAGNVEIAFTEAVNNIVEHAYDGCTRHKIAVRARLSRTELELRLVDNGRPLPGGHVPRRPDLDLDRPRDALPEGGFGWTMIQQLTGHIRYQRRSGRNVLTLSFVLAGSAG